MYVTPDPVTPLEDASLPSSAVLLSSFKDPRDNYLWVVLCQLPHNSITPFVVWLYNGTSKGFGDGTYCKEAVEAGVEFSRRKLRCLRHLLPESYDGAQLIAVLEQYPSNHHLRPSPV